jgi:hypothetical protein
VPVTTAWLGNHDAVEQARDTETGELVRAPIDGKRCTVVHPPDGTPLAEAFTTITHPNGVWAAHSDAESPAWVASDDPALAQLLSAHYGCPVREPDPEA